MIKDLKKVTVVAALLFMFSCGHSIKQADLLGKWNYIKVENPYSRNPPDTVSAEELADKKPYVCFYPDGKLTMIWGKKVLSHGCYTVRGTDIEYREFLPDGKTRSFPFYLSKLTGTAIVFETREDDPVRVYAKKDAHP